jgi:hypothetical protein
MRSIARTSPPPGASSVVKDALGDDLAVAVAHHREDGCLVDVEAHILRRASHESRSLLGFTCVSRPQNRSRERALNMR